MELNKVPRYKPMHTWSLIYNEEGENIQWGKAKPMTGKF